MSESGSQFASQPCRSSSGVNSRLTCLLSWIEQVLEGRNPHAIRQRFRRLQQPQQQRQQQQCHTHHHQAQAEGLTLPVAESREAGHHLQTEEELGRMLQGQLARLRRSWNDEI